MRLPMQLPPALLFLTLSLLPDTYLAFASSSDLPADTPISQLLSLASSALSSGSSSEALEYYNLAISRDPENYLTLFKRGATYLSLGRSSQASADFDKVLALKPGFEGALTQRGKIRARRGDWNGARKDWQEAAGHGAKGLQQNVEELDQAEGAAMVASDAAKAKDWENCVSAAGTAILVASQSLDLRRLRADCRLEKGEAVEALSDLQTLLKLSPGGSMMEETSVELGALAFFGLAERDKGIEALRNCLHSDPESKRCGKLYKRLKKLDKEVKKVEDLLGKRTFSGAVRALTPSANGEDEGLLETIKGDVKDAREQGIIHPQVKDELVHRLLGVTCDAYLEMNNLKRGAPYCSALRAASPDALAGLLHEGQTLLDADDFEAAMHTLNRAKEVHPDAAGRIDPLLRKAQTLLKRSKSKDYYKVLGVSRDANERDIKKAFLKASKLNHPDKVAAGADEATRKAAEKRMAGINEAYEVLRDPELRARFDNGDDPNDPEAQSRGHGGPFHGSPFGHGPGGQQFFFRSGGGGGGGFPGFGGPGGGGFQFQWG